MSTRCRRLSRDIKVGIVAPDGRDGMIRHAEQFAAAGIPFIFDPGQGLPLLDADNLKAFIAQATWVAVNDYEWQVVQQRTGWNEGQILNHVQALIVTRGAEGSVIHTRDRQIVIPSAKPKAWSIRPGAATPTGPACCTACCTVATGRPPGASPRCWAP